MKLLLIADDFTGALDTGVQFVNAGAKAEVFLNTEIDFEAHPGTEIFIVDTETRHIEAKDAYRTVYDLVKRAEKAGFDVYYKKTDSGLRGNVGPEIEALSDALQKTVTFVPAFPKMNRIVKDGISYIDGIPVNESVFGRDPFDPVKVSKVGDLFREQFTGVKILDTETDEELKRIAEDLIKKEAGKAVAGCAGLAEYYADFCNFKKQERTEIMLKPPVLAVCGSINDISVRQVLDAEKSGFSTWPLTAENETVLQSLKKSGACIIENFRGLEGIIEHLTEKEIEAERSRIVKRFGKKIKELLHDNTVGSLIVIGGDTLFSAMKEMEAKSIRIVRELSKGSVLFEAVLKDRTLPAVSKSGGFGAPDWLSQLLKEVEKNMRPIIGITMGDPAGTGAELSVRALLDEKVYETCRPIIIGDANCMEHAAGLIKGAENLKIHSVERVGDALFEYGTIDVYDMKLVDIQKRIYSKDKKALTERLGEAAKSLIEASDIMCGNAAFQYVKKVIELAMAHEVDATVTNALNKARMNAAGHHYDGHTEIYATFTGTKKYAMMLAHEDFRVIHVSTHVSLREACNRVRKARVLDVIRMADAECRRIGIEEPKIGVAGLNPHCGEGGLFGTEEIEEIQPAIDEALAEGINIPEKAPTPPDTVFSKLAGGWYDMVVVMYHDQGHIPTKLKGFVYNRAEKKWDAISGINVTIGLPIIRVSVDHGTGEDIAGLGIAEPASLQNSIEYARISSLRRTT